MMYKIMALATLMLLILTLFFLSTESDSLSGVSCNGGLHKTFIVNNEGIALDGVLTLVFNHKNSGHARIIGWMSTGPDKARINRLLSFKLVPEKNQAYYIANITQIEKSPEDNAAESALVKFSLISKSLTLITINRIDESIYVIGDGLVPFLFCVNDTKT